MSSTPAATSPSSQSQHNRKRDLRRQHRESLLNDFFSPPVESTRYRVDKVIGEGAYGVVVSAIDSVTGDKVAVKRIKKVLHTDAMATRILRELKFLRLLNAHENIVSVKDVLIPSHYDKFNDVFVVMELMPTDLGRLIRSKTILSEQHIKLLMFQLLRGVHFLHQAKVYHRDLNPANILVNTDCQLRICDFGLARVEFQRNDDLLFWTDYVATRWYRAPELIIGQSTTAKYSTAIDMWSVGCIFAEMLNRGKPLFPGRNTSEQLGLILNVTGKPSKTVINRMGDGRFADYLNGLPNVQPADLSLVYGKVADQAAIAMLKSLLAFDPDQRMTASDALASSYFDDFRNLGLGATTTPLDERQFAFERRRLSAHEMRLEFLKEIIEYHPESKDELLHSINNANAFVMNNNGNAHAHAAGNHHNIRVFNNNPASSLVGATLPPRVGETRRRTGHYTVPSQAELFRKEMEETEKLDQARKNRTLSSQVFQVINPDDTTNNVNREMDYKKGTTLGEAELSRIGGGPTHHASSYATHPSVRPTDSGDAMEE